MNKELYARLGNPQDEQKYIHVAGTNGKGSCCAMLAEILKCAGYKTGLYTSPHLERYTERIQINGSEISQDDWDKYYAIAEEKAFGLQTVPFDLYTAAAFMKFKEEACDVVVLEVGLGGRLDATNVIENPLVSVITTIGLEHMQLLGSTLSAIAEEKAGIIKEGCPVVAEMQSGEALDVFIRKSRQLHASLTVTKDGEMVLLSRGLDFQEFSYKSFEKIKLHLLGDYQLKNAAAVLDTILILRGRGFDIPDRAVREGLLSVAWPGRFEILRKDPLVLLDGAHNANGVKALTESMVPYIGNEKISILMGIMADKDYRQMISLLAPVAKDFIFVKPENERALNPTELQNVAASAGVPSACFDTVSEGLESAGRGRLLICGSLYQVSQVRQFFEKNR